MCGWLRRDSASASFRKRARASSWERSPGGSTFTATSRPSFSSWARYTSPMPPAPSFSRIR